MQNSEADFTIESTDRVFKIIDGTYSKADLDNISAAVFQIDKNQHKRLLTLLTELEDLFERTL